MEKLVFATNNPNKIREIKALLPSHLEVLSLNDIGCTEEIPETSETIEENALQKAHFIKDNYGYDCFADDTGLEVEALRGAPGVYSARYAGEEKKDEENIRKLLRELENAPNRRARFKTVVALCLGNQSHTFTGICEGKILEEERGLNGFGYDPVFQPEGVEKSFAEMDLTEKSKMSHRGKAIKKVISFLAQKGS